MDARLLLGTIYDLPSWFLKIVILYLLRNFSTVRSSSVSWLSSYKFLFPSMKSGSRKAVLKWPWISSKTSLFACFLRTYVMEKQYSPSARISQKASVSRTVQFLSLFVFTPWRHFLPFPFFRLDDMFVGFLFPRIVSSINKKEKRKHNPQIRAMEQCSCFLENKIVAGQSFLRH